jgi:hypothetical protein
MEKIMLVNSTVAMEEDLTQWARLEAARLNTSLSRFMAELLKEKRRQSERYAAAKASFLSAERTISFSGERLSREAANARLSN